MSLETLAFKNNEVRVIVDSDGSVFWVAADVASILGYSHTPSMVRRLDEDEKGVRPVHTPGGDQELTVVNEPGLYSCILGSKRPEAKEFKRWVTHEVLPSIRRDGGYINPNATSGQRDRLQAAIDRARGQAEVLSLLKGVVDAKHLDAKGRIVIGLALGETPEIEEKDMPLYTEDYLIEKGCPRGWVKKNRGVFGRFVKQAYIAAYGHQPGTAPGQVGGRTRKVNAYTEADRPLMDRVFDERYGGLFAEDLPA